MKIIELNDSGIKVGDESGLIAQSPGFALVNGSTIETGEVAERSARLQPANARNKYWQELNLEPLPAGGSVRHHADIAYAQLLDLARVGEADADVIFAVPGNFTRQQLAILLGVAQRCPFKPVGVVDSALAASLSLLSCPTVIHGDLQLHQVVLTRLRAADGELVAESVVQIPGVGSQDFMDRMLRVATDLFINQCRFNPQHNAKSEQHLYDALPQWLQADAANNETLRLELTSGDKLHTARLPRGSLIAELQGHYQAIARQIRTLATEADVQLLLGAGLASLPGLLDVLGEQWQPLIVEAHQVNDTVLQCRELITTGNGEGIRRIDRLPLVDAPGVRAAPPVSEPLPTHALYGNHALAVERIEIRKGGRGNDENAASGTILIEAGGAESHIAVIEKQGNGVFLNSDAAELFLNGERISGRRELKLGDRLRVGDHRLEISLIRVSNDGQ